MGNTPVIRFKGFTDDWEERKFDECFKFPVSTNSLSRSLLNYDEGDIKSVHYGDILIKYTSILNVKNDKIPYITDGKLEKYKSSLLENGDLIFADAAEDETVGKAVEVNGLTEEHLVSGLHTIVARSKGKRAEFFLGYYVNSNIYHRQLLKLMQGSKVSSISKGNLQKTLVSFPRDFKEQQKIGSFFKQLDDTIALHQRKLDLLKEQKKGFLQKMFPKNGAKVPELRFAGFADDWEERKLGEFTTSFSGGTPSVGNSSYYQGDIPFIRSGEINSDKTELFLTEDGLKNSSAKMVSVGDILYALYGATSGEVGISQINGAINQAILAIKPSSGYSSEFIMQWLKLKKQKIIDKYLQGGQGNLSGSIVKDLVLNVPDFEEQQKIGSFFKQIDDTIALHQRKLDLLKEQKKGFLQKMFV